MSGKRTVQEGCSCIMANKMELRQINRNIVYRCIYNHDVISRQEIAAETELSIPTVLQYLSELEEKKLIRTEGAFESTGGRRAKMIRCVYDAAYAVGIDITKNHLTIVIIDLKGRIRWGGEREEFPFEDTDAYYDEVCSRLEKLIAKNRIPKKKIIGAGISLPSIVDKENDHVTYGHILNEPSDIIRCFARRLAFKVSIFNDANSGGYAETWDNVSDKLRFYLMLSNSVGGAMIINNEIYHGDNSRSGEIGHTKIVPNGEKCYCGQRGCVNAYLSAKILSDPCSGQLEEFFEKLESGDVSCRQLFDTYLEHLAITVVNLRMLYDCQIILGGYVGKHMDRYMEDLGRLLIKYNPYEDGYEYVQACRYKTEASAVGGALPFITQFIEQI